MAFDPDAFLAGGTAVTEPPTTPAFDPDAFLAQDAKPFDPDEFLGTKTPTPEAVVDTTKQVLEAFTGSGSLAFANQIYDDAQRRGVLADPEVQAFLSEKNVSSGNDFHQFLQAAIPSTSMLESGETAVPKQAAETSKQMNSPLVHLPKPENTGVVSGAVRGAENVLEGLTSPSNLLLIGGLGGAPAVLQKLAGVYFAGTMMKGAGDKAAEIIGESNQMTPGQISEKSTEALGEGALGFLGLKHATGRPSGGGSTVAERPMGLQPDGAEMAARENQLRTLQRGVDAQGNLLPEKIYQGDAKSADPEALQGIALSYAKRVEQLKNAPEAEKPAIQAEIDALDEQLQQFDRKEAFDAIAKARLPGEEALPSNVTPFPEQPTSAAPTTETPIPPESKVGPPTETPPSEDVSTVVKPEEGVVIDDTMAKAVADSAERIADQVTQGQPTSVREAARDAALDNGMSSLRGGKQFSVSFMRKSAQEAAGRAAERQGESLDAESADTGKTKLDQTPAPAAPVENTELLAGVDKAIGSALPERDAAILNGFKAGRTLDDIAAEHGISKQRVSQIVKEALPKLRKALEDMGFTDADYVGGGSALGPVERLEMELRERSTTGLQRAVVDTERLSRGAEPIPTVERQREATVVRDAEDLAASDPTATPSLISRIVDKGDTAISEKDAALLLVERARLMNERAQWEERLAETTNFKDEDVGPRATANMRLIEIENEMGRLDLAQRVAGSTWGRMGHMYQRMIRDDYTLASMERKLRAAKASAKNPADRAIKPEELAKLKEAAAKIEELQKQVDEGQTKFTQERENAETSRMYEAAINELGKSFLAKPGYGKQVFDIAKGIVDRWKSEAEVAAAELKQQLGSESGAIGGSGSSKGRGKFIGQKNAAAQSSIVANLAKVLRAKVGEFGLNKAEAFAEVVKEFGDKVTPHLEKAWTGVRKLIDSEKAPTKVKETVEKGVSKPGVKTPTAAAATAKAEAVAGEGLSHKTAYETVEAVINSGVHGEKAVFEKAHEILKDSFPELTERDVRRAFSEYGKAKFPSKEATKVELAELRRLSQLQESIDRIQKDALDPLKSGLQRGKASLEVREKTKQLNELLKKREGAPSEEKLASRDEAKQTRLKNAIEELDKQLRTGEKPPAKGGPAPDSAATEQLRAERDAMREKLAEIQEAENPGPSPEEKYNASRLKTVRNRIAELQDRIAKGDFAKREKSTPPAKSKEVLDAEFKLNKAKQEFNNGVFNEKLKNRSAVRKGLEGTRDVLNTLRSIRTAFDLSAVLRQGGFITLAHPIRAAKAFPAMFKALRSEKGQFEVNQEIQNRPNAPEYKSSKLHISDPNNPHLSQMEEAYMSRWSKKIPGVSHSERAYTTFLNRLRADSFDAMKESIGRKLDPKEAEAISNFINVATGRGNLAGAAGAAISLNTAFFAPRYVLSRFELLAGQPLYRGTAATRMAVAKEYARYLGAIGVIYGLSQAAGAKIEKDPHSADFGKLRFGNTRVDLVSGLSQAAVATTRFASGKTKDSSGKTKPADAAEVAGRFIRTKLAPVPGGIVDLRSGKNVVGDKVTPTDAALNMFVPMGFGDIYHAMIDQGIPRGTAFALLSIFGAGVQTYKKK